MKQAQAGTRFPLMVYERMWRRWAWPSVLIIPASVVLWWLAPSITFIHQSHRPFTILPAPIAGLILVYSYLAKRLAWVQCKPTHFRIQTLLYPLSISYGRIRRVHPGTLAQVYGSSKATPTRHRGLYPYWGRTAVVVELSEYPLSRAWLRLWISPYLLHPDSPGFTLLTKDWMTLSRQLDQHRNAWTMRRSTRRRHAARRRS